MSGSAEMDRKELLKSALVRISELEARLEERKREPADERIAVVGLGCRFPGGANDPESFWSLLRDGVDAVTEVPADRWDADAFYDPDPEALGKTYVRHGAFLDRVDEFEPEFFGISPREAASMDPQQRLLLEVVWEALEHAGQSPRELKDSATGMFLGMTASDYERLQGDVRSIDVHFGTGVSRSVAAGRISYFLGARGPSFVVDTACSSSLVALHLANKSLIARECDLALAGGVLLMLAPDGHIVASRGRMLSPDGRCKTFDASADGYGRGEGCGIVVLRRLSDAVANGDNILAVVRASAINQDGRTSGVTAPSGLAQESVIRAALKQADVDPCEVSYVETHGTGTSLGDPIELEALVKVMAPGRSEARPLWVGSVKTNIGHLEAAAGIAGFIKVVLALHNRRIPPHLHFSTPNPHLDWSTTPISVPLSLTDWEPLNGRRLACISSFGFSGTNVHAVLEEAPVTPAEQQKTDRLLHVLALSARSRDALEQVVDRYGSFLESTHESLADVCYTTGAGRTHFEYRCAVLGGSVEDVRQRLTECDPHSTEPVGSGWAASDAPAIAFLFTGQGAQYPGMTRQLYELSPVFRQSLDRCAGLLSRHLGQSLTSLLFESGESSGSIHETRYTQPALFAVEYALADLWRSWGIEPTVVLGHSLGEYVAACVVGAMTLEDGLAVVAERGRLMDETTPGSMAAVFATEERVRAAIEPLLSTVNVAAVNGPEQVVISGNSAHVEQIVERLAGDGVECRMLEVRRAFHSPLMDPVLPQFERVLAGVSFSAPSTRVVSNVTGAVAAEGELTSSEYWLKHARVPVRFGDSLRTLAELGVQHCIEVGPHPTLSGIAARGGQTGASAWHPTLRRGRDDWEQILESLRNLYLGGVDVDWEGVDRGHRRRRVALPTYPFQRERHWLPRTASRSQGGVASGSKTGHPWLGCRLRLPLVDGAMFESAVSVEAYPYLAQHEVFGLVVVPASVYAEIALALARESGHAGRLIVKNLVINEPLILEEGDERILQVMFEAGESPQSGFRVVSFSASDDDESRHRLHATGEVVPGEKITSVLDSETVENVLARCVEDVSVERYYRRLEENGVRYGTEFRVIKQLRCGELETVAELDMGQGAPADERYILHPTILDGCFQSIGAALPADGSTVYMPVGVDEITASMEAGVPKTCLSRIRSSEGGDRSAGEVLVGDLDVLDEGRQTVCSVRGLRFKRADRAAVRRALRGATEQWFYKVDWTERDRSGAVTESPAGSPDAWLVFADSGGVAHRVVEQLERQKETCWVIRHGARYSLDGRHVVLDPLQRDHFLRMLASVEQADVRRVGILHLWMLDHSDQEPTPLDLRESQQAGCGSLLHLSQALQDDSCQLAATGTWVVTRGTQSAGPDAPSNMTGGSLWGFARTLDLEIPTARCRCIDLASQMELDEVAAELVAEIRAGGDGENQIAIGPGRRLVRRLERLDKPTREDRSSTISVRDDAVYLVTGGFGGLGLEVVRWLGERGAKRITVMSRHGAGSDGNALISDMESRGVRVEAIAGDVSAAEDVARVVARICSDSTLAGVVHVAGVVEDRLIADERWDDFERVLAPKVYGAWNLHLATRDIPLDFFVMFSAGGAVFGSPGQASYTAANSFLNDLAHYRAGLGIPALSIAWGPWSEVGVAARMPDNLSRWEARGVGSIAPSEGRQILERLLGQASPQVTVMPIDWASFLAAFEPKIPPLLQRFANLGVRDAAGGRAGQRWLDEFRSASGAVRVEMLSAKVSEIVSSVLGLDRGRGIPAAKGFTELGMDSLMAVEISNRLGTALGVSLDSTVAFEHPTIQDLIGHMKEVLLTEEEEATAPALEQTHERRSEIEAELSDLSDEDLEKSLLRELDEAGY